MLLFRAFLIISLLFNHSLSAQLIYDGPWFKFEKLNYADWTIEENQDRISDSLWLTRADNQGIFNIVQEESFNRVTRESPKDTEWAIGSLSQGIENLDFDSWQATNTDGPADQVDVNMVVHIISEDIYFEIRFLEWTEGGGGSGTGFGGGMVYERTSFISSSNVPELSDLNIINNPVLNELRLSKPIKSKYEIYNISGQIQKKGKVIGETQINVDGLSEGIYYLKLEELTICKFVKL